MPRSLSRGGPFYAVIEYDQNGRNYTQLVKGEIDVVEKPVYLKIYGVFAAMLLLAMVGIVVKGKSREGNKAG
jgi:hypothetical protein